MDFFTFQENIADADLLKIISNSPLDKVIKESAEEVDPLNVGMCTITRIEPLLEHLHPSLVSASDRLAARYFDGKKEFFEYIRLISCGQYRTRFDTDGTIWISNGKQRKFDCVPASDVEEILKREFPSIFYMFMIDLKPTDCRHICGLFLYNYNCEGMVHLADVMSRQKQFTGNGLNLVDRQIGDYIRSMKRIQIVGPTHFGALQRRNWLLKE